MANRQTLRRLSLLRQKEARVLLGAKCWEGAYYLAGYAAECALKACIARQTRKYDFPDRNRAERSHSHKIEQLLGIAGLQESLDAACQDDREFAANWDIVKDWKETSRYERATENEATAILEAIRDPKHGVLRWIKQYW